MKNCSESRHLKLSDWLKGLYPEIPIQLTSVSGDASFRHYYRLKVGKDTLIVMDAPPDKENNEAFVELALHLYQQGIRVPKIFHQNLSDGFLVIEDFGDTLFAQALSDDPDLLYYKSIDTLIDFQQTSPIAHLASYDKAFIQMEMERFETWFLGHMLGHKISPEEQRQLSILYQQILDNAQTMPYVFTHRDYHSRNLLLLENGSLGIIDFQDAILAPLAYDLVSLIKDCYIKLPQERLSRYLNYYLEKARASQILTPTIPDDAFKEHVDIIGLQRHIKVLGIFARLAFRDNKLTYLQDIPRVISYVQEVLERYDSLKNYRQLFHSIFNRYWEVHHAETVAR